jgi:hypothetical protein
MLVGCGDSDGERKTMVGSFQIDPRAAYVHVCYSPLDWYYDDGAREAVPLRLSEIGVSPGDRLLIEVSGEYFNGVDDQDGVAAVFSTSPTLLDPAEIHRVPGAIDAGEDFVSSETFGCGGEPTDIPEDFYCTPSVSVIVPPGAAYIFIAVWDSYYEDNTDEDRNLTVTIWK